MLSSQKVGIGKIIHFYPKINVAVISLTDMLQAGDRILIEGKFTHVEQEVVSMQIEHVNIQKAEAGQSIGLKVEGIVREGDTVYKMS
jgi:putative protease